MSHVYSADADMIWRWEAGQFPLPFAVLFNVFCMRVALGNINRDMRRVGLYTALGCIVTAFLLVLFSFYTFQSLGLRLPLSYKAYTYCCSLSETHMLTCTVKNIRYKEYQPHSTMTHPILLIYITIKEPPHLDPQPAVYTPNPRNPPTSNQSPSLLRTLCAGWSSSAAFPHGAEARVKGGGRGSGCDVEGTSLVC
jgi:hypothetical protein